MNTQRNNDFNQLEINGQFFNLPEDCHSIINHLEMMMAGKKSHIRLTTADGKQTTYPASYLKEVGYTFHPKK